MSLSLKQINNLFYDIRDGKSALLLGQEYFKVDPYYSSVLKQLDIKNETPSLNSLWERLPIPWARRWCPLRSMPHISRG